MSGPCPCVPCVGCVCACSLLPPQRATAPTRFAIRIRIRYHQRSHTRLHDFMKRTLIISPPPPREHTQHDKMCRLVCASSSPTANCTAPELRCTLRSVAPTRSQPLATPSWSPRLVLCRPQTPPRQHTMHALPAGDPSGTPPVPASPLPGPATGEPCMVRLRAAHRAPCEGHARRGSRAVRLDYFFFRSFK